MPTEFVEHHVDSCNEQRPFPLYSLGQRNDVKLRRLLMVDLGSYSRYVQGGDSAQKKDDSHNAFSSLIAIVVDSCLSIASSSAALVVEGRFEWYVEAIATGPCHEDTHFSMG